MQYAESQLAFNLLALCQTPSASYAQCIAECLASLRYIRSHMSSNHEFEKLVSAEDHVLDVEDGARLAEYDLQAIDLEETRALSSVVEKLSSPSIELGDVYELYLSLTERARQAMRAYRAEPSTGAGAAHGSQMMKAPWGPALHKLVTALAEKEALLDLIRNI